MDGIHSNNGIPSIECFNIKGTHVTSNNSTNNNVVFFSALDLKKYIITTINPR